MDERAFKERTKKVGLRIIRLVEALPTTKGAETIGRQLVRSGTSIGANYRAPCRGRSAANVIAKLGIIEEEADETIYWLELLVDAEVIAQSRVQDLVGELNEVLAMTVASIKTLRARNVKSKSQNPR